MDTLVVHEAERIDEVYLQTSVDDAREAVLDGGAQSFVVGQHTLDKYSEYLRTNGIDWTPKILPCDKHFRFGNDQVTHCTTSCILPVNFAGRTGHLLVHVLEGSTPFLFPRPLMEKFGLVVDYGRRRLQWSDSEWTRVRQRNGQGHYLLDLAEDPTGLRAKLRKPDFVDVPLGTPDTTSLLEIGESTGHPVAADVAEEDGELLKALLAQKARSFVLAVEQTQAQLSKSLYCARRPLLRRRRCWLVFAGLSCFLSQQLRDNAVEILTFGAEWMGFS